MNSAARTNKKVALISMPFGSVNNPKLALGLLKSSLEQNLVETNVFYFDLLFMSMIGSNSYKALIGESQEAFCIDSDTLLCDWIFSYFLYDKIFFEKEIHRVFKNKISVSKEVVKIIRDTIDQIPIFLTRISQIVNWNEYSIIGFTLNNSQVISSLCFAKLLKQQFPHILIGIGGINSFSPMGDALLEKFIFLDFAAKGEADKSFIEFALKYINNHNSWKNVNGFTIRYENKIIDNGFPDVVNDLDELPLPDYSDYLNQSIEFLQNSIVSYLIPIETSRGCSWGCIKRCIFCGEPFQLIPYRKKSENKIILEIEYLSDKYNSYEFDIADNNFEFKKNKNLIHHLNKSKKPYKLNFSTRANLRREDIKSLKNIVKSMLIGIESFDDKTLKSIEKGTSGLRNIAILKWAKLYDIKIFWNLIYGFSNDSINQFIKLNSLLANIVHLSPPLSFIPVQVYRYSKIFNSYTKYGHSNLKPAWSYYEIFNENEETIRNIAFYFNSTNNNIKREYTCEIKKLTTILENWTNDKKRHLSLMYDINDKYFICDTRYNSINKVFYVLKREALILAICDSPRHFSVLYKKLQIEKNTLKDKLFQKSINRLIDNMFLIEMENRYLSLPIISDKLLNDLQKYVNQRLKIK